MKISIIISLLFLGGCATTSSHKNWNKLDDLRDLPIIIKDDSVVVAFKDLSDSPVLDLNMKPTKGPVLIEPVAPHYPEEYRRTGVEGEVWLYVLISPLGEVVKAIILSSSDKGFNNFCLHAIVQWKYTPAFYGNSPGYYWMKIPMRFKLN